MRRLCALVLLAGLLASCAGDSPVSQTKVDLYEFWVEAEDPVLTAGPVELEVENEGKYEHTLVVSEASGKVIAATDVLAPSASTELRLDLSPGIYQFTCRIVVQTPDGTVIDHYERGMLAEVEVTAGS